MSRSLPILLLAGGGLAAWWASRAAAGDGTDPVADLLSGKGNSLAQGQRAPVNIERLGADVKLPDQAAEFAALRDFGGAVLERGGQLTVQSPNYVLEVTTPPAVEPVRVEVPVHVSPVVSKDGRYVPFDAVYLGVTRSWSENFVDGWLDYYASPRPNEPEFPVFRQKNAPRPYFGYAFDGQIKVPECFVFDNPQMPISFSGFSTAIPDRPIYYDASKDPDGVWWNRIVNKGVRILDISQRPTQT